MMVRKSGYPPLLDGFIIHIFHYFSYQLAISWVYTAMFYSLEGGLGPWRKAMAFHGHKWWRIFCGNLQDGLCSHHETVRYIYNRPSLSVGCFSQLSYLLQAPFSVMVKSLFHIHDIPIIAPFLMVQSRIYDHYNTNFTTKSSLNHHLMIAKWL